MAITNLAVGQEINLASEFNTKLEAPILQANVGLDVMATSTGQAVRWDEFSVRHQNNGTSKPMNYNKVTVANPSPTINTFGTVATLVPPANYTALFPLAVNIVYAGTFGGSETVTTSVVATFSDTTTMTLTKTATAVGTYSYTNADLMSLIKDGVYITQKSFSSESSIANSAVTITFNRCGTYL